MGMNQTKTTIQADSVKEAKQKIAQSQNFRLVDAHNTHPEDSVAPTSKRVKFITVEEYQRRKKELQEQKEFKHDKIKSLKMTSQNFKNVKEIKIY